VGVDRRLVTRETTRSDAPAALCWLCMLFQNISEGTVCRHHSIITANYSFCLTTEIIRYHGNALFRKKSFFEQKPDLKGLKQEITP
jgi:hypothetical protein